MSQSVFNQYFATDFAGLDGESSSLEETRGVNRAVNMEMSVGNSMRGRVGCQTSGSNGFFAIFPYRYTRTEDQYDILYQTAAGTYPTQTASLGTTKTTADGASIERLIGINNQAWMLDTMSITATYVSGTYPFSYYVTVHSSGSNIDYIVTNGAGTAIVNLSVGNGITSSLTGKEIYTVLLNINGTANLNLSTTTRGVCPPYAIINGNQSSAVTGTTSYGNTFTWTVSAHNFSAGDIISWVDSFNGQLRGGMVLSTTATTILYVGIQGTAIDGQILGYMGQPAVMTPITTLTTAAVSGNPVFTFSYWRLIPEGDKIFGNIYASAYEQWGIKSTGSFYVPPVAENSEGNLYIAASGFPADGVSSWANNLIKVDGQTATRAGLPTPITGVTAFVPSGGGGGLTGAYKYKFLFRRYDAQGNIIEGPESSVYSATLSSDYVTVNIPTLQGYGSATGFLVRSGIKHTTESPAAGAAFYVDDLAGGTGNTAFIQTGDPICLLDNTAQKTGLWKAAFGVDVVGTLHKTVCTAYSAKVATISPTTSSIRVADSSGYQINSDTPISCGMTLLTLRNTAGGNQFYELCEMPFSGFGSYSFIDNVTDAVLSAGVQYTSPPLGKEHDAPPPCTLVCQHQGGLVVARGPASPNTTAFSSADGIEYFPTASNSFDVPSTQSGFVTAIASDTDDRLSVFKDRAYYDVYGDLDGGAFSINVKNEGDYGIASQASLVRLPFGLCGLSKNGWVIISDGLLDPFRFEKLNARIVNQVYQFSWATAVNDYFNRQYLCTIPQVSGEPVGFSIDYSRPSIKSMERSYPTKIDQVGGCAMIGNTLYHLSATSPYGVFRRLYRFNGDSPSGLGNGDSFIDNTNSIPYIFESQPITLGEPAVMKTPVRIRYWSIPNDYVIEGWVPFSVLVETGASSLATFIGGSSPNSTTTTLTFATSTDVMKEAHLVNCKTLFYIIRFTTNTIRTSPFMTGYNILFKDNYKKEDLIK